jgi:hypothetical protein
MNIEIPNSKFQTNPSVQNSKSKTEEICPYLSKRRLSLKGKGKDAGIVGQLGFSSLGP